jgi:hypothetical protein
VQCFLQDFCSELKYCCVNVVVVVVVVVNDLSAGKLHGKPICNTSVSFRVSDSQFHWNKQWCRKLLCAGK